MTIIDDSRGDFLKFGKLFLCLAAFVQWGSFLCCIDAAYGAPLGSSDVAGHSSARVPVANEEAYPVLEVPEDIQALPNLPGRGYLYSLHQAMVRDEAGRLKGLVERFVAEKDIAARRTLLNRILLEWAEISDLGTTSHKGWAGFLEKHYGSSFIGRPSRAGWETLEVNYESVTLFLYAKLLRQTHYADLFKMGELTADAAGESLRLLFHISEPLEALAKGYAGNPEQTRQSIAEFFLVVKSAGMAGYLDRAEIYAAEKILSTYGAELVDVCRAAYVAAIQPQPTGTFVLPYYGSKKNGLLAGDIHNNILIGGDGDDTLKGGPRKDILLGGRGDDTLIGGEDSDIYVWCLGDGNDTIVNSTTGSETDILLIGEGVKPGNVRLEREGNTIRLTIGKSGEVITLATDTSLNRRMNSMDPMLQLSSVEFADGTVWSREHMLDESVDFSGTASDDIEEVLIEHSVSADLSEQSEQEGSDIPAGPTSDDFAFADTISWNADVEYGAPWTGGIAADYAGGSGTKDDPYRIADAEQLALMAKKVNAGEGGDAHYLLIADIDLGGDENLEWAPIGLGPKWTLTDLGSKLILADIEERYFSGTFDGAGHTIAGMCIVSGDASERYALNSAGLFGNVRGDAAMIQNLRLIDFDIRVDRWTGEEIVSTDRDYRNKSVIHAGGLVGRYYGNGGIFGVFVSGDVAASADLTLLTGGLVGSFNSDKSGGMRNVHATCNVSGGNGDFWSDVGGLVGNLRGDYRKKRGVYLTNASASGTVASLSSVGQFDRVATGGLVGSFAFGEISGVKANGHVTCRSDKDKLRGKFSNGANAEVAAGGLFGRFALGKIENAFSNVNVTASASSDDADAEVYAGGLIGYIEQDDVEITNVFVSGNVTSESSGVTSRSYTGGLIGYLSILWNADAAVVSFATAVGDVAASAARSADIAAGGLIGFTENTKISVSYATGNVTASAKENDGGISLGGLLGDMRGEKASLSDAYAYGNVLGPEEANKGGMIGRVAPDVSSPDISGCVWMKDAPKALNVSLSAIGEIAFDVGETTRMPHVDIAGFWESNRDFFISLGWNFAKDWCYVSQDQGVRPYLKKQMIGLDELNRRRKPNAVGRDTAVTPVTPRSPSIEFMVNFEKQK